jgi:hypothetical protein
VQDVSEFLAQPQYKSRLEALMSTRNEQTTPSKTNDIVRETIPNTAGSSTVQAVNPGVRDRQANQLEAIDSLEAYAPTDRQNKQQQGCRMTYHDACHLAHGQSIRTQPRELMNAVPNAEIIPLQESEMCCGSAGVYNITQPEMAMQLLERKMKHIKATGARVVVTGNPGCMMQLMLGAQKYDVPVEVKHPVEILDEATNNR